MQTTPQQRTEWHKLCEEATPEWEARLEPFRTRVVGKIRYGDTKHWLSVQVMEANGPLEKREANVRFAVAARAALPLLLDDVERLLWIEERMQQLADEWEAQQVLLAAALHVARLNLDAPDSIRPMTNGAVDAYHRLENAYLAYTGQPPLPKEYVYKERAEG